MKLFSYMTEKFRTFYGLNTITAVGVKENKPKPEIAFSVNINNVQKQPSKGVLWKRFPENMHQITGEHPCRSAISIKLQSNFIEITLRHWCSPVNLLYIFRTPFLKNTSEGLIMNVSSDTIKSYWQRSVVVTVVDNLIAKLTKTLLDRLLRLLPSVMFSYR